MQKSRNAGIWSFSKLLNIFLDNFGHICRQFLYVFRYLIFMTKIAGKYLSEIRGSRIPWVFAKLLTSVVYD